MTESTIEQATTDPLEELLEEMRLAKKEDLASRIRKPSKQPYFYLSSVHKCLRLNYYLLTEGDKRAPVDEWVQAKFDDGERAESEVLSFFVKAGFQIAEMQPRVTITYKGETIGAGKLDAVFKRKGQLYPAEVKKKGDNVWARINNVDDLFKNQWTEKDLRQLLLYLYAKNLEKGFLIILDAWGHAKLIPVYLGNHLGYVEYTLKLMEKTWDAFKAKEIPDRAKYDPRQCDRCNFNTLCNPGGVVGNSTRFDDEEWEAHLAQELAVKPASKEYKELHDASSAFFGKRGAGETVVCGKYRVRVIVQEGERLDTKSIPDEVKKDHMSPVTRTTVKVEEIA